MPNQVSHLSTGRVSKLTDYPVSSRAPFRCLPRFFDLDSPPSLSHSTLLPLGSLSPPLLPFPSLFPFPQTLTLVSGGGCVCVWRVWERPHLLFHTRLFDMVVVDGRLLTSVQYSFFSSMFSIFEFLLPFPFLVWWGVAVTI